VNDSLARVCGRWGLPAAAKGSFERLLEALHRDPEAPTSVTSPAVAADVHVADSLSALEIDRFRTASHLADIGSGAGFPGVALGIAMPGTHVDLIESSRRKCAFLERLVRELGLANVNVVCSRAEDWAAGDGENRYGAVTVRAVGPLATLVEYAAPLLSLGGLLVAWKGRRDPDEERRGAVAADTLGMRPLAVTKVEPFPGSTSRHLHSYKKATPTPAGYPRRPGMAKKRPLGGRASNAAGLCGDEKLED
jgi:16S rRNA (guanine527-N7)-methyltransferase